MATISYTNLSPSPGDTSNVLRAKILQRLGVLAASGDSENILLQKLLAVLNTADFSDLQAQLDARYVLQTALATLDDTDLVALTAAYDLRYSPCSWIDAGAMVPSATNGAAGSIYSPTAVLRSDSFLFDDTTSESVQFKFALPWTTSTLKFVVSFTSATATGGVTWGLSSVAVKPDDPLGGALGAVANSVGSLTAANDLIQSAEGTMTIGGTPVAGDLVVFKLARIPADVSDTLVGDARLLGIQICP